MTPEEQSELVASYLRYLASIRLPADFSDDEGDEQPPDEAWEAFDEVIAKQPQTAWTLLLEVVSRCEEDDLPMVGAGLVESVLWRHPRLADAFERQIRRDDRFLQAFQYVGMTGVPLPVQQQLNKALLDRGVDPRYVVEYDEEVDDEP